MQQLHNILKRGYVNEKWPKLGERRRGTKKRDEGEEEEKR